MVDFCFAERSKIQFTAITIIRIVHFRSRPNGKTAGRGLYISGFENRSFAHANPVPSNSVQPPTPIRCTSRCTSRAPPTP